MPIVLLIIAFFVLCGGVAGLVAGGSGGVIGILALLAGVALVVVAFRSRTTV